MSPNSSNTLSINNGYLQGSTTPKKIFEVVIPQRTTAGSSERVVDISNTELATVLEDNIGVNTDYTIRIGFTSGGTDMIDSGGSGYSYIENEDNDYYYYLWNIWPTALRFKKNKSTEVCSDFTLTVDDQGYETQPLYIDYKFTGYDYYQPIDSSLLPDNIVTTNKTQEIVVDCSDQYNISGFKTLKLDANTASIGGTIGVLLRDKSRNITTDRLRLQFSSQNMVGTSPRIQVTPVHTDDTIGIDTITFGRDENSTSIRAFYPYGSKSTLGLAGGNSYINTS